VADDLTIFDKLSDGVNYTVPQLAALSKMPPHRVRTWLKRMAIPPVKTLSVGNWYSGKAIRDALRVGEIVTHPSRGDAARQTADLMASR